MNFFENIAFEIYLESMKSGRERAKCFMQKEYRVDSADVIDLLASFDDLCRRTANRGTVLATAEVSSQVIVFYKCRSCAQCSFMRNFLLLNISLLQ